MGDEEFSTSLDRIYNLARGLSASSQDAEDLVQETCLLALRGWRRCPLQAPAAWSATICNAARSGHRRLATRPVEVQAEAWLAALPAAQDTALTALASLDAERVHLGLARLPAQQRQVVTLMDLSGFTASEVASVLGCPRGRVLARVHRGRRRSRRSCWSRR